MTKKLYKVRYKIINYTFNFNNDTYGEMETKEEIVEDIGLVRIEEQAKDGLTIIEDIKLLNKEMLSEYERIIEYIDQKGKHKGWGLKKR